MIPRGVLTAADCARYERTAREQLGDECARWLATGDVSNSDRAVRLTAEEEER